MRGSMIIMALNGDTELREFDRPPTLEELQAGVGGYLEVVPFFNSIDYGGSVLNCVAFCNEQGKFEYLPINDRATATWELALKRHGQKLRDEHDAMMDFLVGPVIVLFGDREFMASL